MLLARRSRKRGARTVAISIVGARTGAVFVAAVASLSATTVDPVPMRQGVQFTRIHYCPGCSSAAEIHLAQVLGVEICKLFRREAVSGLSIRDAQGELALGRLDGTRHVTDTAANFCVVRGAASLCGHGSPLLSNDLLEHRNYGEIAAVTSDTLQTIREVRG